MHRVVGFSEAPAAQHGSPDLFVGSWDERASNKGAAPRL